MAADGPDKGKTVLHDSPVYMEGKKDTVEIEIALQYNDTFSQSKMVHWGNALTAVMRHRH